MSDEGETDHLLASIPKEEFIPQTGGKFKLTLVPFRERRNKRFGITRNTFRLGWEAEQYITPSEFRRQLVSTLDSDIGQHSHQMQPADFLRVYLGSNRLHHSFKLP